MAEPTSPHPFPGTIDLARADLGGRALACSDDFFAEMENLLRPEAPVFDPGAYTQRGKLMDGWESRRKRVPGHDWCIVELGVPGVVRGVDVDTSFFLGNHPPHASLEATRAAPGTSVEALRQEVEWTEILSPIPLRRGSSNPAGVRSDETWTHVRLRIYPDGGVARLRVYGEARPARPSPGERVDLAGARQGGLALACSDMFFSPMNNLILPEPAENMGGGWETRRSRPPGDDWIIVRLGAPGRLERAIFDTRHFKGNHPHEVALDGLYWPAPPLPALVASEGWREIVAPFEPGPDAAHERDISAPGPWTHVRLRIYPDGGVSRLRVLGVPDETLPADARLAQLDAADEGTARAALSRCCGARRWVEGMIRARPFGSHAQLVGLADWLWWQLDDADWREAFTHHPRLGDVASLRARFPDTAELSAAEQSGVASASPELLDRLAEKNRAYEARFGFIFIACARGRSAEEILELLERRLPHAPESEIRVAAGEQAKITRLRLARLDI